MQHETRGDEESTKTARQRLRERDVEGGEMRRVKRINGMGNRKGRGLGGKL